jgi:hypothetical protein
MAEQVSSFIELSTCMRIFRDSILGRVTDCPGIFIVCIRPSRKMTCLRLAVNKIAQR